MTVIALVVAAVAVAGAPDRLDRFRELAGTMLGAAQLSADPDATFRELYALLDEEVVESLASGGVFASLAFLQDRLDAFSDAWGATVVRLHRVGGLLVGAFQLADGSAGNSVRVYGALRHGKDPGEPALLTTLSREGRPGVHPLPPAPGGAAQFVATWEGPATGHGPRALRIDHVRQHGDTVRVVWSTAEVFPDGLAARRWSVRGNEIRIHHELHYPGWAPGCDGQTEQEDLYRLAANGSFARVTGRPLNPWHREFRVAIARLFEAVATGDGAALSGLVPDAALRARLPRSLSPEPACDAREAGPPERVSVAVRGDERPWQLVFQRTPSGWRLVRAGPVLQ